jgi:polysaccharide pyruvyl transferase WcaK-like protein
MVELLSASSFDVALLVHVGNEAAPDSDAAVAQAAATELGCELVERPGSLTGVRECIAGHEMVVASRMHAVLNALSVGVPAVSLSYSDKARPLLADLGWSADIDLRMGEPSDLVIRQAVENALSGSIPEVHQRAGGLLERLSSEIGETLA